MKRPTLLALAALCVIALALFLLPGNKQESAEGTQQTEHSGNTAKTSTHTHRTDVPDAASTSQSDEAQPDAPIHSGLRDTYHDKAAGGLSNILDTRELATALAQARQGDEIRIPLGNGEEIHGRINLVKEENGALLYGGRILDKENASFAFGLYDNHTQLGGTLYLRGDELAYEITTTPSPHQSTITLHPLSDVLCHPLPMDDDSKRRLQSIKARSADDDASFPFIDVPILSSRPEATAVIYMDFDGEIVEESHWNNGQTIIADPYNLSRDDITKIWKSVAEDYAPFDIDITTDITRYNTAPVGSRMRCIVTSNSSAAPGTGGVANVNSFNTSGKNGKSETIPCWVFNSSLNGIKEAISHEVGHTLGLRHHGRSLPPDDTHEEYFKGHGNTYPNHNWAPIMGSSYYAKVTQWSHGEYQYANNSTQDDIALIARSTNGFGFLPGGPGDSPQTATPIISGNATFNHSITNSTDIDYYSFTLPGQSNISIKAEPAELYPNLDIEIELLDSSLNRIAYNNPPALMNASLTEDLPAGTYYIKLKGSGYLDPLTTGYSNYGSIGQYTLKVLGVAVGDLPANLTPLPEQLRLQIGASTTLNAFATGNPTPTYQWQYSTDGGSTWQNLDDDEHHSGSTTDTLVITDATAAITGYQYRYTATNTHGSTNSNSTSLVVLTSTSWIPNNTNRISWHDPSNWTNGVPTSAMIAYVNQGMPYILSGTRAAASELHIADNAFIYIQHNGNLETQAFTLSPDAIILMEVQDHYQTAPIKITSSADLGGTLRTHLSSAPASDSEATIPLIQAPAAASSPSFSFTRNSTTQFYLDPSFAWSSGTLHITIPPIPAMTTEWKTDTSGSWSTASNWTGGIPGSSSMAIINKGHPITPDNSDIHALYVATGTSNTTTSNLTLGDNSTLRLASIALSTINHSRTTLTLGENATLHTEEDAILPRYGHADISNHGTISSNATLFFGNYVNSSANVTNHGNISHTSGSSYYGRFGNIKMLNNGTLNGTFLYFGYNNTADISNHGDIISRNSIYIAYTASSNATMENHGDISVGTNLHLAYGGSARLVNHGNISADSNYNLYIASNSGSYAQLENHGRLSAAAPLYIADLGTANVTNHGDISTGASLYIAYNGTANATLHNKPEGTIISTSSGIHIGYNNDTKANITNGGRILASTFLYIGRNGSANLTNAGSISSGTLTYLAYNPGSSANLTLLPGSSFNNNSFNATTRSTIHFILDANSSLTDAPLKVTTAPRLNGNITIDSTAISTNTTLPLIKAPTQNNPALPAHSIDKHPDTAATLAWSADGSELLFTVSVTSFPDHPSNLLGLPENSPLTTLDSVTLKASATGNPSPSIQWQVSTDGGLTWQNLSDDEHHSGSNTGTLIISKPTLEMDAYQYRYLASNEHGSANSNSTTLEVTEPAITNTDWTGSTGYWDESPRWTNGIPTAYSNATIASGNAILNSYITSSEGYTLVHNYAGEAHSLNLDTTITLMGGSSLELKTLNSTSNSQIRFHLGHNEPFSPIQSLHTPTLNISENAILKGTHFVDTRNLVGKLSRITSIPLLTFPEGTDYVDFNASIPYISGTPSYLRATASLMNNTFSVILPPAYDSYTEWTQPGEGSWDDSANWSQGIPGINIEASVTSGTLNIDTQAESQLLFSQGSPANPVTLNIPSGNSLTTYAAEIAHTADSATTLNIAQDATLDATILTLGNQGLTTTYNEGDIRSARFFTALEPGTESSIENKGNITLTGAYFHRFGQAGNLTLDNQGSIWAHWNIHFAEMNSSHADITNHGDIIAERDLHLSRNGSSRTINHGNLHAGNNTYIARYVGSSAILVNHGNYTLNNIAYIAHYGDADITNEGNFTNNGTTYLGYAGNLSLVNNGTLRSGETIYAGYESGDVRIVNNGSLQADSLTLAHDPASSANLTIHPGSTLATNSLNATIASTIHYILDPDSSTDTAPVQINRDAPILDGTLLIDSTAIEADGSYPLIQTVVQSNPEIPAHNIHSAPHTSATLSWSADGSTLLLTLTRDGPPAAPTRIDMVISGYSGEYPVEGDNIILTATTDGNPAPAYQWQISTDGGQTWQNLSDDTRYNGTQSRSLSILNADLNMAAYQYRVIATNPLGTTTSAPVTSIISVPVDYTWNNPGTDNWDTPSNWTPQGIPGGRDRVTINQGTPFITGNKRITLASISIHSGADIGIANNSTLTVDRLHLDPDAHITIAVDQNFQNAPVTVIDNANIEGRISAKLSELPFSDDFRILPLLEVRGNIDTAPSGTSWSSNSRQSHIRPTFEWYDGIYYINLPPDIPMTIWNTPESGQWDDSAKWDNGIPDSDRYAIIDQGTVTIQANATANHSTYILATGTEGNASVSLTLAENATLHTSIAAINTHPNTNTTLIIAKDALWENEGYEPPLMRASMNIGYSGITHLENHGHIRSNNARVSIAYLHSAQVDAINHGTISSNNDITLAAYGHLNLVNNGTLSSPATTIASTLNATADVTNHGEINSPLLHVGRSGNASLTNHGKIVSNNVHLAYFSVSNATLTLLPGSTISTGTFNATLHSHIHYLLTENSSLTQAPIQVTNNAPSLAGNITIDATAITSNATIPLVQTPALYSPPLASTLKASILTAPGMDAYLDWNPTGTALNLHIITSSGPVLLTPEHHLIHALTDNYIICPERGIPLTNGSHSHLPRTFHNPDGTLSISFTPMRSGYTYEVQHSTDLINWTTIKTISSPSSEETSVNSPSEHAGKTQQFLRLKVTPQK